MPNNIINPNMRKHLNQIFKILLYFKNFNPYKVKIKNKKIGVKMPNSFRKNPDINDPNFPKKFLVSSLDKIFHPVSSKLNVNDDKAIKNAEVSKNMPKNLRNNFLFRVRSKLLLLYIVSYYF